MKNTNKKKTKQSKTPQQSKSLLMQALDLDENDDTINVANRSTVNIATSQIASGGHEVSPLVLAFELDKDTK